MCLFALFLGSKIKASKGAFLLHICPTCMFGVLLPDYIFEKMLVVKLTHGVNPAKPFQILKKWLNPQNYLFLSIIKLTCFQHHNSYVSLYRKDKLKPNLTVSINLWKTVYPISKYCIKEMHCVNNAEPSWCCLKSKK